MNIACPTCTHDTHVEQGVGDFPIRCTYCGGLLRISGDERGLSITAKSLRLEGPAPRRTPRGELAGLLLTRPDITFHAGGGAAVVVMEAPSIFSRGNEQQPSARRAAARPARRDNGEALGTFGWVALGVLMVLALIAIGMRAQSLMGVRSTAQADVMHSSR